VVENPKDYALASNFMELYHGIKRPNTKGVPSDWATHMIGHELTAMYGIDHARTLAAPSLYKVMFETKRKVGTIRKTYFQFNWN
jgi:NADP-dependent alcohol dehydrogenase